MKWGIYFIGILILIVGNQAVSDTAKDSVCKHSVLISKMLCWFFTNNLFGFVILIFSIIGLYYIINKDN